jgi:hypothetical protein
MVLEWKFSPPDYFEEPIEFSRQDYTMTIADGKAEAKIDSVLFEGDPSMRQRVHDDLNGRFLAVQVLTHRDYKLSKSTKTRVHPDGRRDTFVEPEPASVVYFGGRIDIRVTDKDGKVISDSKRDRIEREKDLAELVAKYRSRDTLLASLLQSYNAAVRDADNELVHLYEVRDALSARFGGKDSALNALGVSSSQWSRFGALCNDEPLRQGRHRGKTAGALRDASDAELTEARRIAQTMIESYLRHLEGPAKP